MSNTKIPSTAERIAVIGVSCRLPGAANAAAYWQLLCEGREAITTLRDEELLAEGVDAATLQDPRYVKAAPLLDGVERFDAGYFNYTPREAEVLDPQQRQLLECCVEALEDAGHAAGQEQTRVGVYAGAAMNTYLLQLLANRGALGSADWFQVLTSNDKDYLATRVSYHLNLRGPSIAVQTACSSSLVAVHLASQALLSGECDMALAGGVSVRVPQRSGYFYQEGMVASPDGRCRPFDESASGTLFGSGVGVVVLRRLSEALAAGDTIYAVLCGSAVNNDGSAKIGYTAPSVNGQVAVLAEALAVANVPPETIGYLEAHGTGTPLGDPIEVEALSEVFGPRRPGVSCALGSVKGNLGHLDAAAGIAGMIKAVLMLHHRKLVPSLNFQRLNPRIDFGRSGFFVNTEVRDFPAAPGQPRRAGVSSFGIGGTNAHVVLEEAPPPADVMPSYWPWQLLPLSAKTQSALAAATKRLEQALGQQPDVEMADVAYSLQLGRNAHAHRAVALVADGADARHVLAGGEPRRLFSYHNTQRNRPVVFMFPGGGAQHVGMGQELYRIDRGFREDIDRCAVFLKESLGYDIRAVLYPALGRGDREATQQMAEITTALAVLFTVEYALARLWHRLGVQPQALIGHSIGEYVAACLSGVFSLEDALRLVAARGRLMATTEPGAMMSLAMAEGEVARYLDAELSFAALNGPAACVISGTVSAIDRLQQRLRAEDIEHHRLHIAIGAHCPLVEPILDEFIKVVGRLTRRSPQIPFLSNVSGTWITADEAMDPRYWGQHLRQTVRFSDGLAELRKNPERILLEVGPGQALGSLARQQFPGVLSFSSMRHVDADGSDSAYLLEAVAKLWLSGASLDWSGLHRGTTRRRVPLPTYPFEGRRFWVEGRGRAMLSASPDAGAVAEDGAEGVTKGAAPAEGRPNLMTPYVAPSDELEQKMATVWQAAFGFQLIGMHDNFFELGGTSLLAAQLTAALNKQFGTSLATKDLLKAPMIREAVRLVRSVRQQQDDALKVQLLAEVAALSDEEVRSLLEGDGKAESH